MSSLSSAFESRVATYPKVTVRDSPHRPACPHATQRREEGSATPCRGTSTASGDCYAGLAEAAVFSLLQLVFESDPGGYSFTRKLGLRSLKAKSGKDARAAPATQAFSWQPAASAMTIHAIYSNGNNKALQQAGSTVYELYFLNKRCPICHTQMSRFCVNRIRPFLYTLVCPHNDLLIQDYPLQGLVRHFSIKTL